MATKLEKPLKREIAIGGQPYNLILTPEGFTLVPKGKRKGVGLAWQAVLEREGGDLPDRQEAEEARSEGLVQPPKDN